MTAAYVFDTETTSRDDDREIIEAAWIRLEPVEDLAGESDAIPHPLIPEGGIGALTSRRQLFKPSRPITFGSMAVHHILPSDVEDSRPSSEFALPTDCDYLVGHSIDFDWEAAGKPQVKRICTHAMAQWVWPDTDSYGQSALLYMLTEGSLAMRKLLRDAHSAYVDASNCLLLLDYILGERPDLTTWRALWQFSEECRMPRVCQFRQFRGVPWSEVAETDPSFCDWVIRQDFVDAYLRRAVMLAMGYETKQEGTA